MLLCHDINISSYLRVENIICPFCETVFVKTGVCFIFILGGGRKADGPDVNLRTSKWNSLHLIFIFVNDGEINAYNLCKLYCKKKKGN